MGSLTHHHKLPVIDLSNYNNIDPNSSSWVRTREDVVRALEDYGCFIANFDKVSLELHEAIFRASKELFDLPTETKVLNTSKINPAQGYVENRPRNPLLESSGIANANTVEGVQRFTDLMWPNGNHSFCETALSFAKIVVELDELVMRIVSETYGIEKEYESLLGSMSYFLKLNKYRVPQENETNVGVISHTDKSFTTILHHRQVKGLEIRTKDGEWLPVDHASPSSFIVMAGDAYMAWTNGRIKHCHHRVTMTGKEERYSVGIFTYNWDSIIEAPEALVDDEHPLQFNPFYHDKLVDYYLTEEGIKLESTVKSFCGV